MASTAPVIETQVVESQMSDEEFERRTLRVIHREFGLGGLARFIRSYRSGRGDYTADRHKWLDGLTIEDIQHELGFETAK